jgi:hypothetical protein
LTASSNGVDQASEGRDALGVRIEVLAIFLFRNFSQCFLLDDFALRTIPTNALNRAMQRSCDVFERSKRGFFCFASDFFALGADLQRKRAGSPLCVGIQTAKAHAETRRRGGKRTSLE